MPADDDDLGDMTTYATGPRYVFDAGSESEDPTWDDAERAVAVAERILTTIEADLGQRE